MVILIIGRSKRLSRSRLDVLRAACVTRNFLEIKIGPFSETRGRGEEKGRRERERKEEERGRRDEKEGRREGERTAHCWTHEDCL